MDNPSALQRAADILGPTPERKGRYRIAELCGVTYSAVQQWLKTRVPAEHCRTIETATEGRVTRYELRPDVFGDPPEPEQPSGSKPAPEQAAA